MIKVNEKDIMVSLAEMASPLFRKRVWMAPSTEWQSSYVECVTRLFDDSGLQDALERGVVFGQDIDDCLREIDQLTDRIDFRRSEEDIVDDPDFLTCSKIATDILPFVMLHAGLGT